MTTRARGRLLDPELERMNKTEAAYAQVLELRRAAGEIHDWVFEAVKFRLGNRTSYTPDFLVIYADGALECVEIKGFLRDDAAVKFKVAAEAFPWFKWTMLRFSRGLWKEIYAF